MSPLMEKFKAALITFLRLGLKLLVLALPLVWKLLDGVATVLEVAVLHCLNMGKVNIRECAVAVGVQTDSELLPKMESGTDVFEDLSLYLYELSINRQNAFRVFNREKLRESQRKNMEVTSQHNDLSENGYSPFEVLPLEMWEYIADKISHASTWLAFYSSNQQLKRNLENRKVAALLPEVLGIMTQNSSKWALGNADILRCRRVCKAWRTSVDCYLQDENKRLSFSRDFSNGSVSWPSLLYFSSLVGSDDVESVREATRYFTNVRATGTSRIPVTPFPSRDFAVFEVSAFTTGGDMEIVRFRSAVTELLKHFGRQILYFSFTCDTGRSWYAALYTWLKLMPNLKRLNIWLDIEGQFDDNYEHEVWFHPFPRLTHLKTLECGNVPAMVLNELVTDNPQITSLRVIRKLCVALGSFWNCESFRNFSITDFCMVASCYNEVVQLEYVNWPLQKLQIETAPSTGIYVTERLFAILRRFHETLQYLNLELRNPPSQPLELPKLKELKLIFHDLICLDFIWPLESLEKLSVQILNGYVNDKKTKENVQLSNYIDRMEESNIWKLFPRLRKVNIRIFNAGLSFYSNSEYNYNRPEKLCIDFD